MEQESEGFAMQPLEFDLKVRREANLGFQQIRSIEHHLRSAPQGFLGRTDNSEAQALRSAILSASAILMGSFSRVISLLSAPPNSSSRNDHFSMLGLGHPAPDLASAWAEVGRAESPMSTAHTSDNSPPLSPRVVQAAPGPSTSKLIKQSPANSPCHTPPHRSGSAISEGSPPNPSSSPIALDSDTEAGGARRVNEASTSAVDGESNEQRSLTKKRKFMPKFSCKQRAQGTDPLNDGPPDDGQTWRKYGQKDILGSRYPRSYYRCTHKTELGCQAIKYVQRCDEEPTVFNVTYRGNHNCQAVQQQTPWPFPFSPEQFALALRAGTPQLPFPNPTPIMTFPGLVGNQNINTSQAAVSRTCAAPVGPSHISDDRHGIVRSSQAFPSDPGAVGRLPPSTGTVPPASAAILALQSSPARFGVSHPPREMEMHQQVFSVKPEDDPSQQQPLYNLMNRSARDSLFGPGSNLLNMLLTSSKPQNNMEIGRGANNAKQGHHHPTDLVRSNADDCGLMEKSPDVQFVERWEQDIGSDAFQNLDPQGGGRYSTGAESEQSRSPSLNPTAVGGHIDQPDSPDVAGLVDPDSKLETPHSSFMAGFMMDNPVGVMDYDFGPFYG